MKHNKKAFSFVELIITLAIILLLTVIVTTSISSKKQQSNNTKIETDTIILKNALLSYKQENKTLPQPN